MERWMLDPFDLRSGQAVGRFGMATRKEQRADAANPAIIDLFALDPKTDAVVLVMKESRAWDGSDERLHELQEKFNAYVSFLLDGEMAAAHPELAGKAARIELRCDYMPDDRALELLSLIHDQLALQEVKMEVVVKDGAL